MKTKHLALIAATLFAAGALATAMPASADGSLIAMLGGGERVQGNGHVVSQTRQPGAFHGVELTVPAHVEVRIGGDDSLTIEGDDNVVPLVETVIEKGQLLIRPVKKNLQLNTRKLNIVVNARAVDSLGVAGSGTLEAKRLRADKLTLEVAGSGTLEVDGVEAKTVSVEVAGSGQVEAAGRAQRTEVAIAGSGRADTSRLDVPQAAASISGSGQATVAARQALSANITGSGNILYYGDPQVAKAVTGSGSVKRLGGSR